MNAAHTEYFVDLMRKLDIAPRGERRSLVEDAASFMGCGVATIYRRLERVGWSSGRRTRSDCGKLCVDEDLALLAGGMVRAATRANGKKTLPLTTTSKVLEYNGKGVWDDKTGKRKMPSASTMARAMKRYGCHPKQVQRGAPSQTLRTLHPNQVHEMDASVCVLFYLPKGKVVVMDEKKYNENKPKHLEKARKDRVIRWVITDHFSSMIFVRYTLGSEDSKNAIDVMIDAWCKRDHDGDIFHGVPNILYTDKGPAFVSTLTKTFLNRLKVQPIEHAAGNAQATGQAEKAHDIVETQFEGFLRFLDIDNLEELNAHLDAWRIAYNATVIHKRHKKTRNAMWMHITPGQLRIPESVEALKAVVASPPAEKKVKGDLILRYTPKGYEPQTYSLYGIEGIMIGGKIGVALNPYEAPAVDVIVTSAEGEERIYTLQPIKRDRAGFDITSPVIGEEFKALKDTITDKAIKRMDMEAHGVNTLEEAEKAKRRDRRVYKDIDVMAHIHAVKIPDYMPRRGEHVDLGRPERELPPISVVDAAIRIKAMMAQAGIAWTSEHMTALGKQYPDSLIPVDAIDGIAEAFIAEETDKTFEQPLRLVAGGAS